MSLGPIRPRFARTLNGAVEDRMDAVTDAVVDAGDRYTHRVLGNHIDITLVRAARHLWSPTVQLEFAPESEEPGEQRTVVHGLVGPHPNVWTLYVFLLVHAALIAGFGLMLGFVQLGLGQSRWAFWLAAVGTLLVAALYAVSQIGRRFAKPQTADLMRIVDAALRNTPA